MMTTSPDLKSEPSTRKQVLVSWKEIAAYTGKGVRTVQRWEHLYGLPVRRPTSRGAKSTILIDVSDLHVWLAKNFVSRGQSLDATSTGLAGRTLEGRIRYTMGEGCEWTTANQALVVEINQAVSRLTAHCSHPVKLHLELSWSVTAPKSVMTSSTRDGPFMPK